MDIEKITQDVTDKDYVLAYEFDDNDKVIFHLIRVEDKQIVKSSKELKDIVLYCWCEHIDRYKVELW